MVALELFLAASARMTKRQFRSWLAVDWQRNNAAIFNAWRRLFRRRPNVQFVTLVCGYVLTHCS
jgi:hypothetical protein